MNKREDCLWERLKYAQKPIVLYGTGNGADKILDELARRQISVSGVFSSDGFVRQRMFRDMKVQSYSQILEEFGDFIVLVAFGSSLPEVFDQVYRLRERHELYLPEVPLYGGPIFDFDYYLSKQSDIEKVRSLLSDKYSVSLLDEMIHFRLTGELSDLARSEKPEKSYQDLFLIEKIQTILDGGAFRGDTSSMFAGVFPNLKKIIACEPDPRTFQKLAVYASEEKRTEVFCVNAALWNEKSILCFEASGSRGSGKNGAGKRAKTVSVVSETVDSISKNDSLDLLKLDVEGAEAAALSGAKKTIERDKPALAVSLYHKTDDLFDLIFQVHRLQPDNKLFLRRDICFPAWDLVLFSIPSRLQK